LKWLSPPRKFGKKVEDDLIAIARKLGAKGTIYYQNEALGTGHASQHLPYTIQIL
jgi:hypothetical protein